MPRVAPGTQIRTKRVALAVTPEEYDAMKVIQSHRQLEGVGLVLRVVPANRVVQVAARLGVRKGRKR